MLLFRYSNYHTSDKSGEWQSNKTPVEDQVRTLKEICAEIYRQGKPELYWSVEANSIGEAALVVIRETGEEMFCGTMLHDPRTRLTNPHRRGGFVTTHKSKLEACAKLKYLVEKGKITINSQQLISELKTFVARANSFEARLGQTDDLVMATLLFLRMAEFVATWDTESYKQIINDISTGEEDAYGAPMPCFI